MGILLFFAAMMMPRLAGAADDYAFDTSETDKKPYSFGGYMEAKPTLFALDRDAALYKTRFYNRDVSSTPGGVRFHPATRRCGRVEHLQGLCADQQHPEPYL